MQSFKAAGREWLVRVNVATIKRVRTLTGVDLRGLFSDGLAPLQSLVNDPVKLVDVLYVVCRDEADNKYKVTDEQFGESMEGNAVQDGAVALLRAVADFFPEDQRPTLHELLTRLDNFRRQLNAAAAESVKGLEVPDAASILKTLTDSSGGAPASSGSTPPTSPSGS